MSRLRLGLLAATAITFATGLVCIAPSAQAKRCKSDSTGQSDGTSASAGENKQCPPDPTSTQPSATQAQPVSTAPWRCDYQNAALIPGAMQGPIPADVDDPKNFVVGETWVSMRCYDPTNPGPPPAFSQPFLWDTARANPVAPNLTPLDVAMAVFLRLHAPEPEIRTWPPAGKAALVHQPVWLHVTNWATVTKTASEQDLTITLTLAPDRVVWDMGQKTLTCTNAGPEYDPGDDPESSTCSHTYTRDSGDQPDGKYHNTATFHWNVTWAGTDGIPHPLPPITATRTFQTQIDEWQTLVTPNPNP